MKQNFNLQSIQYRLLIFIVLLSFAFLIEGCSSDSDGYSFTESGIDWVTIPEGHFFMGTFEDPLHPEEEPIHTVYLTEFQISQSEVTNAQYAIYLNEALEEGYIYATASKVYGALGDYIGFVYFDIAGEEDPVNASHITYVDGFFSVEPGYENWPVTYVSWYGAHAYTNYFSEIYGVNMGLPTEAEWEYAASGEDDFVYPTDDGALTCSQANFDCNSELYQTLAVGSYLANPWGLSDMAGNVREWCWDWYDPEFYVDSSSVNPVNLSGFEPPQDGSATGGDGEPYSHDTRVLRGGSYKSLDAFLRSSARDQDYPFRLSSETGFRVVLR